MASALALLALLLALLAAGEQTPVAPPSSRHAGLGLRSLPLRAQAPVSAALGAHDPAYLISPLALRARNPAQQLRELFTPAGVTIGAGKLRFGMRLEAAGSDGSLRALGRVVPRANSNRAVYPRGGVSEWYVNGPLGLEQGFTVARPLSHTTGRENLTLEIALSGNGHISLGRDGRSFTVTRAGAPALRYSGLVASDARGRSLRSWLALEHGQLLLNVDAKNARYPVSIDPFIQRGTKTTPGVESSGQGLFGFAVALSADGRTAIVGAPNDSPGEPSTTRAGAAWVFTRSGESWVQQGPELIGTLGEEGEFAYFGVSVALSADGNTALVGATGGGLYAEPAYVFTRSGSTWTRQALLRGQGETESSNFGSGVTLSADGNTALVGGSGGVGGAWVFTRSEGAWNEQGPMLTGSGEQGPGGFGEGVALSTDGDTALVGAPNDDNNIGAAWVFTRDGESWQQQGAKLTGREEAGLAGSLFGDRVALSADGDTALIGGPADNGLGKPTGNLGAAWVFTRSGESWSQQGQKLTGGEESGGGGFGRGVALSADGNTALIGGQTDGGNEEAGPGAAWVFTRSGTTWTQLGAKLIGGEEEIGAVAGFGGAVALSSDGRTALIGAAGDNNVVGAAWTFTAPPPPPTVSLNAPADETITSQAAPTFTWSSSDENGPGIAGFELLLDGTQVAGELPASARSFTPSSPLPDGSHTWQVRATDRFGDAATTSARAITVDTAAPTVPGLLEPTAGGSVHQATPTFSWNISTDAASGVANYSLLIDNGLASTVAASGCPQGSCSVISPRALANGAHSWQVLATDRAGNTAASATGTFTVAVGPAPPPGNVGVSIDDGNYATNTPHVELNVVWPLGANEALVSNDGGFNAPGETVLQPVAATIPWTLRSAGSETLPKTVYLRFPDSATPTTTFSDDIILDQTQPIVQQAKLLTAGHAGASAASNHGHAYRVRVRAREAVSGISVAEISDRRSGGTTVRVRSRVERGLTELSLVFAVTGHTPRYVRVQSAAGTWSSWRRLSTDCGHSTTHGRSCVSTVSR